jgi:hypothetical protein
MPSLAGPFLLPFWASKKEEQKVFEIFKGKSSGLINFNSTTRYILIKSRALHSAFNAAKISWAALEVSKT